MGPLAWIPRRAFAVLCCAALAVALLTFPSPAIARGEGTESDPAPADPLQAPPDASPDHPRYRLQPVVVTPDRFPIRLDRIPSDVTVLTTERLETRRPLALSDALRLVPGIDVQRAGSVGKLTDVRLRGVDPRHTLVLYDGIPLNGPWIGSFDFADFMGAGENQVEVFGGPASSLYGSGAVGGVIQILNAPSSEAPERRLFAEYGEGRTFRQGVAWRTPLGA